MTGKQWVLLVGLVLLGMAVILFVIKGVKLEKSADEGGGWICQSGTWVKFGKTNEPRPVSACR